MIGSFGTQDHGKHPADRKGKAMFVPEIDGRDGGAPLEKNTNRSLESRGFIQFNPTNDFNDIDVESALEALRLEFASLPQDPHGQGKNRYRCYGQAFLFPNREHSLIEWRRPIEDAHGAKVLDYDQQDFNVEFAGTPRRLPALTDQAMGNPLLQQLILYDWNLTSWDNMYNGFPYLVGVHLVKLEVYKDGQEAVTSPNHLHRDGEPYTFAHLINRDNVLGAENVIAPPQYADIHPDNLRKRVLTARFDLSEPLDSYGVSDHLVSHHVGAVRKGPDPGPAERSIILVDFTPMRPFITAKSAA